MIRTARRLGLLAAGLLFAVGCAQDRTTAPAAATVVSSAASHGLLGSTLGAVTGTLGLTSVNGLQRTTALANDITVTKTIGIQGGTLSIPAAGVTVVVPYGALSQATTVSMTARKGTLVAYDFAPHGITFAVPLVFTQQLAGTNAGLLSGLTLKLGYYTDPSLLGTTTGLVSELINGVTNLLSGTFTAPIKHFSGYLVIC